MNIAKQQNRERAFCAIDAIASRPVVAADSGPLQELLSHPYQYIRLRAAELLGFLPQSLSVLAIALNDQSEPVRVAAANSLLKIGTPEALEVLCVAFAEDELERPHYLSNAIAGFGTRGFEVLAEFLRAESPTLRYFAARGLGSTNVAEAELLLVSVQDDSAETSFGGKVGTAARHALKTLRRMQAHGKEG